MKKIFRMALVFALAGATLMYTSCTKDYQEEINKLDGNISNLESSLNGKLADLQTELSNVKSSVSSLETAYKAADKALGDKIDGVSGDVSSLKTKVAALEAAVADLDKLATKDELSAAKSDLEKKIADDLAALKAEILEKTDDLAKQLADLKIELEKKADAEDVEIRLKALEEAQASIDEVYGFLSDELRSIVFLPDFYFAGIESTSYDFGSFIGWDAKKVTADAGLPGDYTIPATPSTAEAKVKYVIPKGQKIEFELLRNKKANGKDAWYKYDPETFDWIYKDGKLVEGKEGDANVRRFFPGNHVIGQIGKAMYNLNPSSFPVDSAEWSLLGRNVKYVLKSEDDSWYPVFEGISKDETGLATVEYSIENPEKIFSSILGALVEAIEYYTEDEIDVIGPAKETKNNTNENWMEEAKAKAVAEEYGYNNIPTMQLVGTLSDGRDIHSDWHAVSSFEEFVDHLAFHSSNQYRTNAKSCDMFAMYQMNKDLYLKATDGIENVSSVKVKYNGGPVDLAKLIAIHTTSASQNFKALAEYTIDEFNAKYPGYHFEFELTKYTLGGNSTSEDMYGKLDGSVFTPCYVESAGGKATSIPIEKDSEDGVSAVGRMPVVLVTLVNDETKHVQAYGWFKLELSQDDKPAQFFPIPDLGKVPYICDNYTLATKWHEFSFFVLEALKVDYTSFIKNYKFEGVYAYGNVLWNNWVIPMLMQISATADEGKDLDLTLTTYDAAKEAYVTLDYGTAKYAKDSSGSGINDAFTWKVNPLGIGEGKSNQIYFKFVNGDQEVYFVMTADVAERANMSWVSNKLASEWFTDINNDPFNTARINVPVPIAKPIPDVMDFERDINHFFQEYKPVLGLTEDNDPVYAAVAKDKKLKTSLATQTSYQFSTTQPAIDGVQLFVRYWDEESKLDSLFATTYDSKGKPVMETLEDGETKVPKIVYEGEGEEKVATNLVAFIYYDEDVESQFIRYADTDIAKVLLNKWSYKLTDDKKMLYANIVAKNTYGWCNIELPDGEFYVRFIRPIDIDFQDQDIADESAVDGANVEVAKFISGITDWNNQSVIVKEMVDVIDEETGKVTGQEWTGYYIPNVIKTIDMYEYYGFSALRINMGKAERNNVDLGDREKFYLLSVKTPKAKLQLGSVKDDETFEPTDLTPDTNPANSGNKIYTINISDFNTLREFVINYQNDEAYSDFFTLRIPIEIDYSWGTLPAYLTINIKDTGSTDPH